jgi:hypothetical protein
VTLQDLGSIGSFVAAIATLITLIYLAIQIRQNSESVKSAAAQSVLASLNEAIQSAASTPQLSRVVALGQSDYDRLSEDERQQFLIWLFGWFRIIEQAHHNYVLGHLEPRIWRGYAKHIESVMQAPAVRRWWKFRRSVFSPEFQQFIDGLNDDSSVLALATVLEGMRSDEPPA